MDKLVALAHEAKAQIKVAKGAATLDWYRRCAAVVADEKRHGDVHGAQRRAAARLGISAQYLGRMLDAVGTVDTPNLDS